MQKKSLRNSYGAIGAICLLAVLLTNCGGASANNSKGTLTIAVAEDKPGTANEPYAHSIYAGAKMAAEQANAAGGVAGYAIKIVPYADDNNVQTAQQNAQAVAQSDAAAVIGHSSGETINAAAPVYTQANLPAINASPISSEIIGKYPTYFNTTYTTQQQAAYLANYAIKTLGNKTAAIIYMNDSFGQTLAQKFENTFHGLGGTIALKQVITRWKGAQQQKDIDSVVAQLFAASDPGVVFIASDAVSSAELVIALKDRGFANLIMGADNLNTLSFINIIRQKSGEQARPGYYTDGIISTRSLLPDSASGFASQFAHDYEQKYPNFPVSNSAARGYDAALAIFSAIRDAQINGDVKQTRAALLKTILGMTDPQRAAYGVVGPLYFERDGNAPRQVVFSVYQNGHLVPAPIQFEPIPLPGNIYNLKQQIETGRIITLDGRYVYVVNMIYTGIDIIEMREISQIASTYTADFYLWFRYKPQTNSAFKPDNIIFMNAESINSKDVIREETTADGSVYKTLRVSGTFKNQFNFQAYPFDQQDLVIRFRNQDANASFIQYAVDRPGMRYNTDADLLTYLSANAAFDPLHGWKALTAHAEQKLFSTTSTLGNPQNFGNKIPTDFSVFDIDIQIKRAALEYVLKSLLPLLITLVLAYITFYLPLGHSERLGVGSTALITTAFFHLSLASSLPEIGYTVAMEYFFYAAYGISALIVLLETLSIRLEKISESATEEKLKAKYEQTRQTLNVIGRIVYPTILLSVLGLGGLAYLGIIDINPHSGRIRRAVDTLAARPEATATNTATAAPIAEKTGPITLLLNTWRPEDDAQLQKLLAVFNKKNPDIVVVHAPIAGVNYDNVLQAQLNNYQGPDLFFVQPFDAKYATKLLDITSLPLKENFDAAKTSGFKNEKGDYYAAPYVGVIQGVYYNKAIFKQLNLSVPKTWEELLSVSKTLKDADYIAIANSANPTEESDFFMTITPAFLGGQKGRAQYMVANGATRCFNDPYATRAFQALADVVPYLSADATSINSYTSKERFINQKAAMLFGGSWDVGYFSGKAKFDWGVFAAPAPAGQQTYVVFAPDIAVGVNANIPLAHQQAALRFLQWLMTPESLNMTVESLPGFYPLSKTKINQSANAHGAEFQRLALDYPTDIRWAYSEISMTNQYPRATDLFQSGLNEIVLHNLSAQKAADRLQSGMAQWYAPAQNCKK